MQNINDIYNFVQFELNKNQSGDTLNQDEFNLACGWANLEYFKFNFGLPEQYKVGQPSAAINYENTQLITDRLRKFKQFKGGRDLPSLAVDVNGQALYPSDYVHYSSIRYGFKDVTPVRDSNLGSALDNSITAPDKSYPIMVFYDTYMQFYPMDLDFVNFTYLRMPVTPFWAVTIVNDSYVYDSLRSIQFEWGQDSLTDIANLILSYAARNLKDQLNLQGSERRKTEGI
jgi:hypothetical protein